MGASTQDMINQLMAQTAVTPQPSFDGISAPADPAQLQALLGKLRQQQQQQQVSDVMARPTGGEFGYLHDAGKAGGMVAANGLGSLLQSAFAPQAAPQAPQGAPFSMSPPDPAAPDAGIQAPTPNPGATPQQSISNAVKAAQFYHRSLLQSGTPADQANLQTLTKMTEWGVPGASDKLAAAQEQVVKNAKLVAESGKDTAQGNAATDEMRARLVDEGNRATERTQADTRLKIEQQNADSERMKANQAGKNAGAAEDPLSPGEQLIAKKIADGEIPMPPISQRNPRSRALVAAAIQMNPDVAASDYQVRLGARKSLGYGTAGNSVRSVDVAYDHLDTLQRAFEAANNGDLPLANSLVNLVRTQTGGKQVTDINATLPVIKAELTKAVVGAHAGEADRGASFSGILANAGPQQFTGAIKQTKELMMGQLNGFQHQYSPLIGKGTKFEDALTPAVRRDFAQFQQGQQAPPPPAGGAAPAPASGWGVAKKVG